MQAMSNVATPKKKDIEVEFRARFPKKKYDVLVRFLRKHAKDLGADDKRVWFFVMPDKLLKVTHNISSRSGKITLKLTKIGLGSHFKEIEFPIAENSILSAVDLFMGLGHAYLFEPTILRHNYLYKGVEVALKYSDTPRAKARGFFLVVAYFRFGLGYIS
jgi:hypothetical protein